MLDQSVLLDQVRRHWKYLGKDSDRAHEMYHDDAVLEFPQSGERFAYCIASLNNCTGS